MADDQKKPDQCLHCAIVETLNAHGKAYGTGRNEAIEALAMVTTQLIRDMMGEPQYPGDPPPSGATH